MVLHILLKALSYTFDYTFVTLVYKVNFNALGEQILLRCSKGKNAGHVMIFHFWICCLRVGSAPDRFRKPK